MPAYEAQASPAKARLWAACHAAYDEDLNRDDMSAIVEQVNNERDSEYADE